MHSLRAGLRSAPDLFLLQVQCKLPLLAMQSRVRPVVSGHEEMADLPAEALEDFETEGYVWIHGERWTARSKTPVTKGQRLSVTLVDGLILHVEPADQEQ